MRRPPTDDLYASFQGINTYVRDYFQASTGWTNAPLAYYAMVTSPHWLRMKALFKLGMETQYKKEVLGGGLASFINSRMWYFFCLQVDGLIQLGRARKRVKMPWRHMRQLSRSTNASKATIWLPGRWSGV